MTELLPTQTRMYSKNVRGLANETTKINGKMRLEGTRTSKR